MVIFLAIDESIITNTSENAGVKVGAVFEFATRWVDPSNKCNQVIEARVSQT